MARFVTSALVGGLALIGAGCKDAGDGSSQQSASPLQDLWGIDVEHDQLIRINALTGAGTAVGAGLGLGVDVLNGGADFACDGTFWAFSSIAVAQPTGDRDPPNPPLSVLYTVDLTSGLGTVVQTFDVSGHDGGGGFEIGPDEQAFFWREPTAFNRLEVVTGTVTLVAQYHNDGASLTINPSTCTDFLTVSDDRLNRIAVDGTQTEGPPTIPGITSLAVAPDGTLYAHAAGGLYTLDPATGAAVLVGPIGFIPPGTAFGPDTITCNPRCGGGGDDHDAGDHGDPDAGAPDGGAPDDPDSGAPGHPDGGAPGHPDGGGHGAHDAGGHGAHDAGGHD